MSNLNTVDTSLLSPNDQARLMIQSLPHLSSKDLDGSLEDSCPICLVPFTAILAEEELERDEVGVTKLVDCGHVFCRKDLAAWIRGLHGSCPTCRNVFLDIFPLSDSDDESSDGGEYIPDEDAFRDDTDGFSEYDLDIEMDMEMDELWADGDDEYEDGVEDDENYEGDVGSGREYEDDESMETDWGLSEGDTSSEMDSGYPLDETLGEEIPVNVVGEDSSINSDNVLDDGSK